MTDERQEWVEVIGYRVLTIACLTGGVVLGRVNVMTKRPMVHDRQNWSKVIDEVNLGESLGELMPIVFGIIQLKGNRFLIYVRGTEDLFLDLVWPPGRLTPACSVMIARSVNEAR
jgi:hypothetical protein